MRIDLKCCCGAEFHGEQDGNFCIALEKQIDAWRMIHVGCPSRFAPPTWTYTAPATGDPLPPLPTITCDGQP